ncbi:MAG: hypothetical protein KDA25_12180, partial [Phycisphaerales bacterium]|nr:hypothetical protein [Phycisphaerales bacterium]
MHASTALNDRNDLNPPIRRLLATGRLALGVAALLAAATLASGAPLYVDDDAPPGGDGLSWETAMNDLGAALALAGPQSGFDEVRVAEGTYRPGPPRGSRTSSFPLRNLVRLAGGYAGMNAA